MEIITVEILGLLIIPIVAIIASLTMSIIALVKSNQTTIERHRPTFDIVGLSIDRSKLEVFIGAEISVSASETKPLEEIKKSNERFFSDLTSPDKFMSNINFTYGNTEHWMINLIPKKTKPKTIDDNAVIGFNALEIEFEFSKNSIKKMEIMNGFTIFNSQEVVSSRISHRAKFKLSNNQRKSGKLTIPITYVSLEIHEKVSLLTDKLNNINDGARLNILDSDNPKSWLGFDKTGYLVKLTTIENYPFYYSMIINPGKKNGIIEPISNGSVSFLEGAKAAKVASGEKKVIQGEWLFWRKHK